jgi:hypothetical protein
MYYIYKRMSIFVLGILDCFAPLAMTGILGWLDGGDGIYKIGAACALCTPLPSWERG